MMLGKIHERDGGQASMTNMAGTAAGLGGS